MEKEKSSTYIFLEGLSCSGKTCLLKTVKDIDVDIILKNWPIGIQSPPINFFLERDEDKLSRAKYSTKPLRLVDRGYLSTLTFYSVLEEQEGISAEPVYKWFINELGNKLYRPNHYFFVDIPAEVSIKRAKECGRVIADNNMWLKFPTRVDFWYNKLLSIYEPATSLYKIDGNRDLKIVSEEFNDLLNDLKKGNIK